MTVLVLLILAGLALWCALALPLALLVGGAVRLRDQGGPVAGSRSGRKAA